MTDGEHGPSENELKHHTPLDIARQADVASEDPMPILHPLTHQMMNTLPHYERPAHDHLLT